MVRYYILTLFLLNQLSPIGAQSDHATSKIYTYKKGDLNGTGKWYMGREIAYVMGYQGINWLERPSREKEENVNLLIENMSINAKDVIADIGAGSGYHVFQMASKNPNGKIYAVDIQPEMLNEINAKKKELGYEQVMTILNTEQSIPLPENSIDKILMVDVYHEFSYPREMMLSMLKALTNDGRIYLVEYRGEDEWVPIKKVHKMTAAQAIKEMEAVGLILEENIENLPWQHCMIFKKK